MTYYRYPSRTRIDACANIRVSGEPDALCDPVGPIRFRRFDPMGRSKATIPAGPTPVVVGTGNGSTVVGIAGSVRFDAKRGVIVIASGVVDDAGDSFPAVGRVDANKYQRSITLSAGESDAVLANLSIPADQRPTITSNEAWRGFVGTITSADGFRLVLPLVAKTKRGATAKPKLHASDAGVANRLSGLMSR